jgi:hypothetical protein
MHVIDVACPECMAQAYAPCVKPNGRPLSRLFGNWFDRPGPGLVEFTSSGQTYYARPYIYHRARRFLFRSVNLRLTTS